MYGDTIQGEYVSIEENKKIEMKWKFKDWNEYAQCVITFDGGDQSVDVTVQFKGVPDHDRFGNYIHLENI